MHRTIFDTPVVNTFLRVFANHFAPDGVDGGGPVARQATKSVLIAAPHTSNWDLPYTLMLAFVLRLRVYWMGKHSLFKGPLGPVMRWLGIPVNREQANNLVASSAEAMRLATGPMQLIVPPEGTRGKTKRWKRAFISLPSRRACPSCWRLSITAARWGPGAGV